MKISKKKIFIVRRAQIGTGRLHSELWDWGVKMTHLYDTYIMSHNLSLVLVDVFLKKVDNASLQRYGPTYAYM